MAHDIKQLAHPCETCREMKPRLTLKNHWNNTTKAMDLGKRIFLHFLEIAGKHFLVVEEYDFNFIETDLLTSKTSTWNNNSSQETFCAVRHTKSNCVRSRSSIYQSRVLTHSWQAGVFPIIDYTSSPIHSDIHEKHWSSSSTRYLTTAQLLVNPAVSHFRSL